MRALPWFDLRVIGGILEQLSTRASDRSAVDRSAARARAALSPGRKPVVRTY